MADEQEVIIKISTDEDLSGAETLDDLIEQLRDKASDIPLDFDESPAEEDVDNLSNSLEGLSDLAVGDQLQKYGDSAEQMAQQMNQANISVGQLATNVGMNEGEMIGLINGITNATFPQDEALAYVNALNQMGVDKSQLADSATNMDRINDATGIGYDKVMQLTQGLRSLGVDASNLPSSFNAISFAQANVTGGADTLTNVLGRQAPTLNKYGVDVDQAALMLQKMSEMGYKPMKMGSELSKVLKENDGDLRAVEQSLGMQPGALSNAGQKTGEYKGKLQKLADEEMEHKTLLDHLRDAWDKLSLSVGSVASPIMGVAGLGGQVAGFGAQLNGTWNLLSKFKDIGGISGAVSGLSGAFSGVGSSLIAFANGPVGIAIAAIIGLGIAIYEIGKYFGWWSDVGTMLDALKAGVMELWNAFMSNEYVIQIIDLIKQGLTDAWNAVVQLGTGIMEALSGGTGEFDILSFMVSNLGAVLNAVGPIVMFVIQAIIQHFRNLYNAAIIIWPYVADAISGAIGIITGVINTGKAVFQGLMNVWSQVSGAVGSMSSAINGALSAAGNAWNGFKTTVMNAVQPILDKIHELEQIGGAALEAVGLGGGGIETASIGTASYGGATTVTQGNTIIFNMYGDIRDEKTLDETIDAINNRIQFENLSNGVNGGAI